MTSISKVVLFEASEELMSVSVPFESEKIRAIGGNPGALNHRLSHQELNAVDPMLKAKEIKTITRA